MQPIPALGLIFALYFWATGRDKLGIVAILATCVIDSVLNF